MAAEALLIRDGVAALRAGNPTRALELFDTHAVTYPAGALAEEREAERILALADLGRTTEARDAFAKFLRTYPTSSVVDRLRAHFHAPRVRE